ncbi:MAG: Rossmann-like and DUF2520 domain-containing protein [Actinomycetota bacterium]
MDVSIVGAGRVGSAFDVLLTRAGHRIVQDAGTADVVLITTPDDRIEEACAELAGRGAFHGGQFVAHASGATGLDALHAAAEAGAEVLSIHPLQTFPDMEAALERVPGSAMAVTARSEAGHELGERLARDLGASPFRLAEELKPLYHAAAVLASNDVVAVLAQAERVFQAAGVIDRGQWMPLVRSVIDAVDRLGPGDALTGPVVRGDAGTLEANLEALKAGSPQAVTAFVTLSSLVLDLAERSGRLSDEGRRAVEEVLARWT